MTRTVGALVLAMVFGACASFRPRDSGRLKLAEEAAAMADSLRMGQGAVFELMEDNLELVAASRKDTEDHLAELELQSFWADFDRLTRSDLADDDGELLGYAYVEHQRARAGAADQMVAARDAIKKQLARQKTLAQAIHDADAVQGATTVDELLDVVTNRIDWIDDALTKIHDAASRVRGLTSDEQAPSILSGFTEIATAVESGSENVQAKLDAEVAKIKKIRTKIAEDHQVLGATELLLGAGQEIALSESRRLEEMRRHLSQVKQIHSELEARHKIFTVHLMIPAMAHVDVDRAETIRTEWNDYVDGLIAPLRDSFDALESATPRDPARIAAVRKAIDDLEADKFPEVNLCAVRARNALYWGSGEDDDPLVTEYFWNVLNASEDRANDGSLTDGEPCPDSFPSVQEDKEAAGQFAAAMGIIRFVELPKDQRAVFELATELHRHSIRMSAINARQRMDLVHQVAEGLRIYYSGGVTSEEAAGLVLEAARVLALSFIGLRV